MPESLEKKAARAKAAQAKRIGTANKKKKKCTKGKSCGFSCISGSKVCLVDLASDISTDTGKVAKEIESRPKATSKKPPEDETKGKAEALKQHLKENSFTLPGKSFGGEDIANMVNQAAKDLDGEARENISKLMDFIVRDKTGVFVTESKDTYFATNGGPKGALDKAKKWALSKEFLSLLDRTFGVNVNNNFTEMKEKMEEGVKQLRSRVALLKKAIEDVEKFGGDARGERGLLNQLNNMLATRENDLKLLPARVGGIIFGGSNADGWTMQNARFVAVQEDSKNFLHGPYDKNRGINSKGMQDSIAETMEKRAKATNAQAKDIAVGTFHFSSGFGWDRMGKDARNEQILLTFTHEMGHQIHYRAGVPDPPPNLPSMSASRVAKGITDYATVNPREMFAEAFVAYTYNPAALRKQDPKLYDWVNSTVNTALANAGSPI